MGKKYIRDKRSPKPLSEATSKVMSANRAKDTKPEILFRKALWANGIRGYRLNWRKAPGRPDIAFPGKKIAIFINGCYWHRCPKCDLPLPRTNTDFWKKKFDANKIRDVRKEIELKELGWDVYFIWECDIDTDLGRFIQTITNKLFIER